MGEIEEINKMMNDGIRPMQEHELANADFINSLLPDKEFVLTFADRNRDLKNTVYVAGRSFNIYRDKILIKKLENIALRDNYETRFAHPHQLGCTIGKNASTIFVHKFQIPTIFDRETPVILGHEYHHALKDTNPEEYLLQMGYADVIPIFYELVMASKREGDAKSNLLKARINMLNIDKKSYRLYHDLTGNVVVNAYKISKHGEYLNSYYYALALFNVYKEKPEMVLGLVSKVLKHEMTTVDLLMVLDLYDENLDHEVREEHDEIIKAL